MAKPTALPHQSWLSDANDPATDFPLTHLPFGAFATGGQQHLCVAIGTHLLDLNAAAEADLLPQDLKTACQSPTLNAFLALGPPAWAQLRRVLTALLEVSAPNQDQTGAVLHSIAMARVSPTTAAFAAT